jgi:hypothetical protein
MFTKEQIGEFQTELGLRFSPDMGGTPPTVEEMAELIKIGKAARSLLTEINGITSHVEFEDYAAADAIVEASEPKSPFDLADEPETYRPRKTSIPFVHNY